MSNVFGRQDGEQGGNRRGPLGGVRWLVLLGFAFYAGFYWFSNRSEDPYTGEKVLIDNSLGVEDEKALGLQAYREILAQEHPLDPQSQVAQQVRSIAQRLIAKVDVVEPSTACRPSTTRAASTGTST